MKHAFSALWERVVYRFWNAVAADFELRLEQELATSRLELASLAEQYRKSGAWEAMKVAQDAISESYAIAERAHAAGASDRTLALSGNGGATDGVCKAPVEHATSTRALRQARKAAKRGHS